MISGELRDLVLGLPAYHIVAMTFQNLQSGHGAAVHRHALGKAHFFRNRSEVGSRKRRCRRILLDLEMSSARPRENLETRFETSMLQIKLG